MINLVQLHLNRGIKTWYAEINENGVRKYKSLRTKNKKEAMTLLTQLNSVNTSKLTLQTVWERYMSSHVYSHQTVSLYNALYKILPPELLKRHFCSLKRNDWMFLFATDKWAVNTRKTYKRQISALYNYAISEGICSKNVVRDIRLPQCIREHAILTKEQVDNIVAEIKPKYKIPIALMAYAGLRIHEALKASSKDINGDYITVIGKGDKQASVPLSNQLKDMLPGTFDCKGIARTSLVYELNRAAHKCGIEGNIGFHIFRHSLCSNLSKANVPIVAISKIMRHSRISTTLNIYSHVFNGDLKTAIEKI